MSKKKDNINNVPSTSQAGENQDHSNDGVTTPSDDAATSADKVPTSVERISKVESKESHESKSELERVLDNERKIKDLFIENIFKELEGIVHLDELPATHSTPRVQMTESQRDDDRKKDDDKDEYGDDYSEVAKDGRAEAFNQPGKHILYSKYVDQGASVLKESRRTFLFELSSQLDTTSLGENEAAGQMAKAEGAGDFTYGYRENRQYILPSLTEHETQRLGGNKFLEDATRIGQHIDFRDHIALCLSYLTVVTKNYLKETFRQISDEMKLIGKVYSARMLGLYHEYAKMFKFSAGREGGMVASMRFTSHCSDIIKSYIHLAEYLDDPYEFGNFIYELAKRHFRLGLKLRDHQVHFKPFAEIIGSWHEDPMKTYCALIFFLSLISRSMMKAEIGIKDSKGDHPDVSKMTTRSIRMAEPKRESSRKQPTWD